MELLKPAPPARFQHKDVAFLVRTQATDADKFEVDTFQIGRVVVRDGRAARVVEHAADVAAYGKMLIRLFVVGWEGVTEGGRPAPYSFERFLEAFPADPEADVSLELLAFIRERVDIFQAKAAALKNGSGEQSTGSSGGGGPTPPAATPSAAPAATA